MATAPASTASASTRQWRICFEWTEGDAQYVEITDYH